MIDSSAALDLDGAARDAGTHCFVCAACGADPGTPLLDEPLRQELGVGAVIAGAGPLSVGYVLIVPERHSGDVSTAIGLDAGFLVFVERALAEYEALFGPYTFWEHGSASGDVRRSGCISHAHLNVIPRTTLTAPPNSRMLDSLAQLGAVATSPYLLLGGSGTPLVIGDDTGVSQHYRREWAAIVGRADRWDYAVTGGSDLQGATRERYGS